jgi:hypothetical protein
MRPRPPDQPEVWSRIAFVHLFAYGRELLRAYEGFADAFLHAFMLLALIAATIVLLLSLA